MDERKAENVHQEIVCLQVDKKKPFFLPNAARNLTLLEEKNHMN